MHWYATVCKSIVAVGLLIHVLVTSMMRGELNSTAAWYATALALNSPLWTAHAEADVRST